MTDYKPTFFSDHFFEAIEKGHIHAYYQPIYRSMTGRMMCAESLARWIDPDLGMFSPAMFIPVLEECDLIFDLDMEILRQTCKFYQDLCTSGLHIHSFSVNLSRQDFRHEDLYDRVVGILADHNVPHDAIKLEITETLMLEDAESFSKVLQKFNEAGFSMWMDDFGSGYSSLNVLKNYKFDLMKFDMLFLKDFSVKGQKLLASMINMAKSLGIHTLAEGVELKDQQLFLQAAGCEALQGFYYTKPVPKEDLISMIEKENILLESNDDKSYWSQIGQINLLSAHPLEDYFGIEADGNIFDPRSGTTGVPIALLECTEDKTKYVYASNGYLKNIKKLGYDSLAALEDDFNNHRAEDYLLLKKLLDDAIKLGTIKKIEYYKNEIYYKLSAICLARKADSAMIALYLSTFDSEREVETAKEMISYSNSLFSTYDVVVLVYPERGIANRLYTSNSLPQYDKEVNLQMSIRKFTEAEVCVEDQERYLKFLDPDSMVKRIESSPRGFIQDIFRMCLKDDEKSWNIVRLSKVPSMAEKTYILTIQKTNYKCANILETISREHPELLK
ncbi:MAG: EAL domain-containing protein [Clostridiales bacterium]|nr:EAL domain-containing protein [Clostridiales bacterium]